MEKSWCMRRRLRRGMTRDRVRRGMSAVVSKEGRRCGFEGCVFEEALRGMVVRGRVWMGRKRVSDRCEFLGDIYTLSLSSDLVV